MRVLTRGSLNTIGGPRIATRSDLDDTVVRHVQSGGFQIERDRGQGRERGMTRWPVGARHRCTQGASIEWMSLDDSLAAPRPGGDKVDSGPSTSASSTLDEGTGSRRQSGA